MMQCVVGLIEVDNSAVNAKRITLVDLQCTMCSGGLYNWVSYVAIAFVPLTIFLVLVLCCRISATSPQLYTFVTYSQIFATPVSIRILLVAVNRHPVLHY